MPPKRKRKLDTSPVKEAKKETKEEKKERIELQKLRAKKWAEERRTRAVTIGKTETSSVEKRKTAKGGRKSSAAATPKKKPASASRSSTGKSRRATPKVEKKDQEKEEEEEIIKPSAKRRRITKPEEEESDPVHVQADPSHEVKALAEMTSKTPPNSTNGDGAGGTYEAPTPMQHFMSPNEKTNGRNSILAADNFMSPEVFAAAQNSGLNIVYVPVNVATASTTQTPSFSIAELHSKSAPSIPPTTLEPPSTVVPAQGQEASVVQIVEEEEDEFEMEGKESSKLSSLISSFWGNFVKLSSFMTFLVVLTSAALFFFDGNDLPTNTMFSNGETIPTSHNTNPCFYNHGFGGENEEMDITCDEALDCPQYGRCEGGKLIDCLMQDINWSGGFYVPSEKGDQCVVSSSALQAMLNFHSTLTELTVEYVCRSSIGFAPVCRVQTDDLLEKESILFEATAVASYANLTIDQLDTLLERKESDDIVEQAELKEDELVRYIGLSKEFINMNLPISNYCWLRIMSWDIVRVVSDFLYGMFLIMLNFMWTIAVAHPGPALVLGIVSYGFLWFRNKRSRISRLRKEASEIQNVAYDKLVMDCNEGEGYASLHLRDEIAHELYPEPCAARQRFNSLVWHRVAALIRADNRVTKSRKSIGGKSLEYFEWASDSSRKSRRSLAANSNVLTRMEEN